MIQDAMILPKARFKSYHSFWGGWDSGEASEAFEEALQRQGGKYSTPDDPHVKVMDNARMRQSEGRRREEVVDESEQPLVVGASAPSAPSALIAQRPPPLSEGRPGLDRRRSRPGQDSTPPAPMSQGASSGRRLRMKQPAQHSPTLAKVGSSESGSDCPRPTSPRLALGGDGPQSQE